MPVTTKGNQPPTNTTNDDAVRNFSNATKSSKRYNGGKKLTINDLLSEDSDEP